MAVTTHEIAVVPIPTKTGIKARWHCRCGSRSISLFTAASDARKAGERHVSRVRAPRYDVTCRTNDCDTRLGAWTAAEILDHPFSLECAVDLHVKKEHRELTELRDAMTVMTWTFTPHREGSL
jgi:hypothetical protein